MELALISKRSMASFFTPLAVLVLTLLAAGAIAHDHDGGYGGSAPSSPAPAPHVNKTRVWVEGVVYCQSCAHRNPSSLDGAAPLAKAKVTVTCRDAKNRVTAWRSATADEKGYFLADFGVGCAADFLESDPTEACYARLLASPDSKCNDLTNINGGTEGAQVRDEGKRWPGEGYENAVFAAGPLAFRPSRCAPTHHY